MTPDQRPSSERPRVTAIVTSYNEERSISDCLESLQWCDEILLVDSFSTDRTLEVAGRFPEVRILQHEYFGAAAQKNWAARHATHEWLLFFDSDERCTPPLREEIEQLLTAQPEFDAYTIRRDVWFLGKRLRFSGWQNDRVVRLVRAGTASYERRRVHAQLVPDGPAPMLRNSMEHRMVEDLPEYTARVTRYGVWGAAQCWRDGKRSGLIEVIGRPAWRLGRDLFLFGGVLDGMRGWISCALGAYATFVKWSVLWGWRRQAARGIEPELPAFDDDPAIWADERRNAPGSEAPVRPETAGSVSR